MREVFQPEYVSKFNCITSECNDTCCCGWRVMVDEDSYMKYQELLNSESPNLFEGTITNECTIPVNGSSAEIIMLPGNICPFLNKRKMCSIQEIYGESYISVTCSIFPRIYNLVNGQLELVLDMSCPHAANLALSNPSSMRFEVRHLSDIIRINKIPTLNLSDTAYPDSVYSYFGYVRTFILELLQNRNYCFENRLVILGRFCDDLNLSTNPSNEQVLELISEYRHFVDTDGFGSFIKSIPDQPAAFLKTLTNLIEYQIKTSDISKRFTDLFELFKKGLNYSVQNSDESLYATYSETKSKYYMPFMKEKDYIFENYYTNYVFKMLFPFGTQSSIFKNDVFFVNKNVFTEYVLMALHYAFIKNILVGIAGFYKEQFGMQEVLKLIQVFEKNIVHDVPYQQKLLRFFDENKMLNVAAVIMLIKS